MRTLCLVLVGVVIGWAASGVDWTRGAVGEEIDPITGKPILQYSGLAAQPDAVLMFDSPKPASIAAEGGQSGTGQQAPFERSAEAATTTVTEGVIPAPPQKGLADWLGEAQKSAGIGRYNLKVAGSGYYVIDSLAGRVWYGTVPNAPQLIAAELPQK